VLTRLSYLYARFAAERLGLQMQVIKVISHPEGIPVADYGQSGNYI